MPSSQPDLDEAIMALPPSFDQDNRPVDSSTPLRAAIDALPSLSVPASQPVVPWAFISPEVAILRSPALPASIADSTGISNWDPTPHTAPSLASVVLDPPPGVSASPPALIAAPVPSTSTFVGNMLFSAALTDAVETTTRVTAMTAAIDNAATVLASVADVLAQPESAAPSPGPGDDWAHQPDRSPTAQEIALARHTIATGQVLTINDFSSGAPLSLAVSTPLPADHDGWLPEVPHSELSLKTSALASSFPSVQEHLYVTALELNGEDLHSAAAWLGNLLKRGRSDVPALMNAFPDASEDDVKNAFQAGAQSFRAAYHLLLRRYKSSWAPNAVGPNPRPGAMDSVEAADAEFYGESHDFSNASQSHSLPESRWWSAMVTSRASKFPEDSRESDLWPKVTQACVNTVAISPCTLAYIRRLSCLRTAPRDFQDALQNLQALPSFPRVFTVNITHDNAVHVSRILLSLLRGGLLTPGACAWLAEYSSQEPLMYESSCKSTQSFPQRFSAIWRGRNTTLHRWRRATLQDAADASSHPSREAPIDLTDSNDEGAHDSITDAPPSSSVGVSRHSPGSRASIAPAPYQIPVTRRRAAVLSRVPGPPSAIEIPRRTCVLAPIIEWSPDHEVIDLTSQEVVDLMLQDLRDDAPIARSLGLHPEGTLDGSAAGPSDLTSKGKKRRAAPKLTLIAERRARQERQGWINADRAAKGQSPLPPYADPSQRF